MRCGWLVMLVVAVFLAGCGQEAPHSTASSSSPSPSNGSETWQEVTSEEGAFSILMPGMPEQRSQAVDTAAGPVLFHSYSFERNDVGGQVVFMTSYGDYPKAAIRGRDAQEILDRGSELAAERIDGVLVNTTRVKIDGYPGRDLLLMAPDVEHTIRARLCLVGSRLYQVMVLPAEHTHAKDALTFLDSFALLEE